MSRAWKVAGSLVSGALALIAVAPVQGVAAEAAPTPIPQDAPWLTTVNYFREMAGLTPVVEDATLSAGAYKHSCYMVANGVISHDESSSLPKYTPEGDRAGRNGNVAVSSAFGTSARSHIELWMTGPFHAIGILRPNLQRVGFGKCDDQAATKWRSGATLDVLQGLGSKTAMSSPVLWPGNGTTTHLNKFIVETPDPRTYCGWSGQTVGLPVIALMPEAVNSNVTARVVGPAGEIPTCALSRLNTDGSAQAILGGDNAVVAVPQTPLGEGTYQVTVTTQARTVTWSFTVDADAAVGVVAAAPTAAPSGPSVGFQPLSPARVVDTRDDLGATRLVAGVAKTISIAGRGGVPVGAQAISANFTIVNQVNGGYLTVWNCGPNRPVVSTVNFTAGEVAPNAATVPLDANGNLCVFSTTDTDLVIDVNGAYGSSGSAKFTPVTPARLMDTREGLGATGPLASGQTVSLQIAGQASVPAGVSAVTLNVTSTDATNDGYVTVWACDAERPLVSNLNPTRGRVRPNLVVTPVAADGSVCLYTLNPTHLVVDVTGYLSGGSVRKFTPSEPVRFVDTRDRTRPEVNAGTGGGHVLAGQTLIVPIAGVRGVPTNAKAVSLNLTVTNAAAAGYITAWPCGDRPVVSTANYEPNNPVSNGAQLPLSGSGSLCIFSNQTAHVVVDVNGWWS
ncbi:MAG: CAP domain-containing protein [Ilumatobacteraceae bacterium]